MKLVYSADALADLVRLRAFVAERNPESAARVAAELVARIENMRRFPELGRAVEQAPDPRSIRDMVFGSYIVRYTAHAEAVIVLRIWHYNESR